MRIERMSVALRARNPWEAMDLGMALVRRHAWAIWKPWLLLSLPLLVLLNALAWAVDLLWLVPLLMWWLKPLFDRIPLFVLSRAVFGDPPGTRQVLAAPELRAGRSLLAWLSWRRLHPARALLLPVDMLEGLRGARRSARCAVLMRAVSAQAFGLMLACLCFEAVLLFSAWFSVLMFVPSDFFGSTFERMAQAFLDNPPDWAQVVVTCVSWGATTVIEPFYVAAGFGLYLNRRTQLEAWDVELGFRRLAERAREALPGAGAALALMLALCSLLPLGQAQAATAAPAATPTPDLLKPPLPVAGSLAQKIKQRKDDSPQSPREFIGDASWREPDPRFAPAVAKAFLDPQMAPKKTVTEWKLKHEFKSAPIRVKADEKPPLIELFSAIFGAISEFGLWVVAGLALAWLLWRMPKWLPWIRAQARLAAEPTPILEQVLAPVLPLPGDIGATARGLWQGGQRREALALVYRASVERVAERLGAPFPPGATEAECLRRARRLPEAQTQRLFTSVVRTWQAAAYAWRYPDSEEFEALLQSWSAEFGARA